MEEADDDLICGEVERETLTSPSPRDRRSSGALGGGGGIRVGEKRCGGVGAAGKGEG
jgi:hypothetical protein